MIAVSAVVFTLQSHVGMATGDLNWNIARDRSGTAVPNVLSELKFEDVDSVQGGIDLTLSVGVFSPRLTVFAEGGASYGSVRDGDNSDADFAGNDRTGIYSLSESRVRGDHLAEYRGGVGFDYALVPGQHYLALIGGGYFQEQHLNFQDGTQLIADPGFFGSTTIGELNASLVNLDSDYQSEWWGPWAALRYRWEAEPWSIAVRQQWYWADYYGEGHWNLREDFAQPRSFVHEAEAGGRRTQLRIAYALSDNLDLDVSFLRGRWETEAGVSTTYFSNDTIARSRFNGGEWQTLEWRIGLAYTF